MDKLCETKKSHIAAAAVHQSGSEASDLNIGFQCQLLRINVQKLLSNNAILDCSSPII